jgi:hypothetical protein
MQNQLIYSRKMVQMEGHHLRAEISQSWSNGNTIDLELALVVNSVTYAILNPCEQVIDLISRLY